jgi:hypothetical protein
VPECIVSAPAGIGHRLGRGVVPELTPIALALLMIADCIFGYVGGLLVRR